MLKKTKGCAAGLILGSAFRLIVMILEMVGRIIGALLLALGLWIPALYLLFGGILYLVFHFNPFSWETTNGQIYFVGLIACCVCAAVIAVRNLVFRPAKSFVDGFRKPIWTRKKEEKQKTEEGEVPEWKRKHEEKKRERAAELAREEAEPERETYTERRAYEPREREAYKPKEIPKGYFSKLEADSLIHEYADRFEVYAVNGDGEPTLRTVEYK